MVMPNSGIYSIVNKLDFKIYIGSAVWFDHRWRVHRSDLYNHKHGSIRLQRAWDKYGKENFEFKVLERVIDKEKLLEREQFWIDRLNPYIPELGYNIQRIAGSRLGAKHTEEFKKKQSQRYKGIKQSQELIIKRTSANIGKKRTQEQKDRMSKAQRNRVSNLLKLEENKEIKL